MLESLNSSRIWINNANYLNMKSNTNDKTQTKEITSKISQKNFLEKNNDDKKTKKIIKYSSIVAGIGLAVLVIFKRKQIWKFITNLFKKNSDNTIKPQNNNETFTISNDNPPSPPTNSSSRVKFNNDDGNPPPPSGERLKIQSSAIKAEDLIIKYYELCYKYNKISESDTLLRKKINSILEKFENQLQNIEGISWEKRPEMANLVKFLFVEK